MSLTWLLDDKCFDKNLPELKDEITRQGCKYITGKYKPFGAGIEWNESFKLKVWLRLVVQSNSYFCLVRPI